ncbi:MAG: hypothetical protein AB3A66_09335 [Nodularia sp. CChRGM 3473]
MRLSSGIYCTYPHWWDSARSLADFSSTTSYAIAKEPAKKAKAVCQG